LIDLARAGTPSRFTFDSAGDGLPTWSPGGDQTAFASTRTGVWNAYVKVSGGGGQDALAFSAPVTSYPMDWSADGRFVAVSQQAGTTGMDLSVLPLSGHKKLQPFLQTPFNEDYPAFSPDGRWNSYSSDASGRTEGFMTAFPAAARSRPPLGSVPNRAVFTSCGLASM